MKIVEYQHTGMDRRGLLKERCNPVHESDTIPIGPISTLLNNGFAWISQSRTDPAERLLIFAKQLGIESHRQGLLFDYRAKWMVGIANRIVTVTTEERHLSQFQMVAKLVDEARLSDSNLS